MNMVKSFTELNGVPFMDDLCTVMNFKSDIAKISAKNAFIARVHVEGTFPWANTSHYQKIEVKDALQYNLMPDKMKELFDKFVLIMGIILKARTSILFKKSIRHRRHGFPRVHHPRILGTLFAGIWTPLRNSEIISLLNCLFQLMMQSIRLTEN
ncbi:LOW QUALITY PROTEIN: hypothetical protein KUTeg_000898 [Tegillarca granosa]|uniref:Uncharacterized protein n=1 Tax=Tegillarca granosa TaxID=220873 RepID=A0ABQ9FZH8_TEGGR|nr:LOW QUALITY PROTEIN: hypothetical protein KUTeg_000898 [Tegillarca granosa]